MKTVIVAFATCFIASAALADNERNQFSSFFTPHPEVVGFDRPGNGHGRAYGHFKHGRHKHHSGRDRGHHGDFRDLRASFGPPARVTQTGNASAPGVTTAPVPSGAVTAVPEGGGSAGLLMLGAAGLFAARARDARARA